MLFKDLNRNDIFFETMDEITENPFHDYIPVLFFIIFWIVTLIVLFGLLLTASTAEKWAKPVFIGCTSSDFEHIYIFRLIMETPRMLHDISRTTLELVLVEEKNNKKIPILKHEIDSRSLNTHSVLSADQPHKSVVRFLVFTQRSLRKMSTVSLQTEGRPFKVFDVEVQELGDPEANVSYVSKVIRSVNSKKQLEGQTFKITARRVRTEEDSAVPSRLLNRYEYIVFIWMAFNLIAFVPTLIRLCTGPELLCDDYNDDWLSSVYTGLLSSCITALTFALLITVYRYLIKYYLEKYFYHWFWKSVRISYLLLVIAIGCASAVFGSLLLMNHSDDNVLKIDVVIYWLMASVIGIAIFLLLWVQLLTVLATVLNFFKKPHGDKDIDTTSKRTPKSPDISVKRYPIKLIRSTRRQTSLKKTPPKMTPPKMTPPKMTPPKKTPTKDKEEDDNQDMEDSDNYFQQLMSGTKVKSISQYRGVTKSPPKEQKSQKKEPEQKETQEKRRIDTTDDESVGDSYYMTLMQNQKKVTSISQYK